MGHSKDHRIIRDNRGEDQPKDKARAKQVKAPAAGSHAKSELEDDSKTPAAGSNEDSTSG